MTDATPQPADRTAAMLDRLAEMDLSAAEHVHAQLLATTEPKALAELARAGRALRQVLMLRMKRERDLAEAELEAADERVARTRGRLGERIAELQDAVARVAAEAHPDSPDRQGEALDRLDIELDDWVDVDVFADENLDDQVLEACRRVDLPLDLAAEWRDLPDPPIKYDPATMEVSKWSTVDTFRDDAPPAKSDTS